VHIAPEGRPGSQYKQLDESSFVAVSGYREFCKSCASARNYRMLSGPFRLHKDFMISGRLSLPPMSTFQDHSVVSAHRSRRDMLVERSQASARKAERTHSPHELTESYCSYACLEIQEVRSVLKPFFRWVCPCRAHDGGLFDAFDRYQYPWTDVFPLSLGAQRSGAGRGRLCTGSLSARRGCWMGEEC
jgi:hypothetical protein